MEPVKTYRVFLVALSASLCALSVGNSLGWTSPVLPKLKEENGDSPFDKPITLEQEAWISSAVALGAVFGPFPAGTLADLIGRKGTLLSSSLFFIVAFIIMMVTKVVWLMILSRFLQGLGVGFVMAVLPIYMGEIAFDRVRGAIGSFVALFIISGIFYIYVIGAFVSYQALQWACLAVPIIFDATFLLMPDTPYYYIAREKKENAVKALQFLRGQSAEAVQEELSLIENLVAETLANKGKFTDLFTMKGNRRAMFICCGLVGFQQLCGITVVLFNAQSIFEAANTGWDAAISSIIISIVQVLSSLVTPLIVDRVGRKIILYVSAIGMSFGLFALGGFFYVKDFGDESKILWLPLPSLIAYNIVYNVGFGPLPWAILGEMFPPNVKSIATRNVAAFCWTLGFILTRWYPQIDALGSFYAFWFFGICCIVAFVFTLFIVIETKGLSLQEIQNILNEKKET